MKKYKLFKPIIITAIIICISFLLTEYMLRVILFTNFFNISRLKNPQCFADECEDDYWKLHYKFSGKWVITDKRRMHFLLGWSQTYVNAGNPLGLFDDSLKIFNSTSSQNKILFYGDSFVKGVSAYPFQIPVYMNSHLQDMNVIDLSCAGYGLDQMFLMFNLTQAKKINPYIIFGILTEDLDRATTSVRVNQKPYYVIKNNELELKGLPISKNPKSFFSNNPPKINSYLFRIIYRNFAIKFKSDYLNRNNDEIRKINSKIIEHINDIVKKKKNSLLFVLFYSLKDLNVFTWREAFLKNKLSELEIPYFDTKSILIQYSNDHNVPFREFYGLGGHHNDLGNKIIAEALLRYLSENANIR